MERDSSVSFRRYLALLLGQKQRQREGKVWPQVSKRNARRGRK